MTRACAPAFVLIATLCCWNVVGAQALAPKPPADGRELLEQGRRAFETRQFRAAAALLERTVEVAPGVEAYFLLGRAYWGEDRPYSISAEKAIVAFQQAVALDPTLASPAARTALEQQAVATLRNERVVEARAAYVKLLDGERDRERVARFRTQIDEIDLELGVYKPLFRTTYNTRGEVLGPVGPLEMQTNRNFEKGRHTSDPVREEEHYRRAIETDPTMHQAYHNLAQGLMHQGRYAEAIPYLEQAARVWELNNPGRPPYVRAHTWLVKCHLELGNLEKAIEHRNVLDAIPGQDNWEVLFGLLIEVESGRAKRVLPALEEGARTDPDNVDILQALATAYVALGRYSDAARAMQEALDAIPPGHKYLQHVIGPWRKMRADWAAK